jgi:hypothetical protein
MAKNIAPVATSAGAPAASGSVVNASGAPSNNTKLMPKRHNKDVDPANQPIGAHPYAPREVSGAQYGVQVGFEAHTEPAAGMTQANGRIVPSAINRSAPNFRTGIQESY